MPLPDDPKMPWPPPVWAEAYRGFTAHSAWYSGDPQKLTAAANEQPEQGVQQSGWKFWKKRQSDPATRLRLHLPLAADLAMASADMLFAESPTFTVDDNAAQGRVDEIVATDGVVNTLLESAEVAAALGGVFLRVVWDLDVADHPILAPVHADAAVPEFQWGRLRAVTFWRTITDDGSTVVRHLERHEPGLILHGVYQGTKDRLGAPVPLEEHPETKPYASQITDDGQAIVTGVNDLTARYVPNMRPNRALRSTAAHTLGRSDYQGVEPLMDSLDETWTSWMRDLRLARARLIVPKEYLRNLGKGEGAVFNIDQEVFTPLEGMAPDDKGGTIHPQQFEIRTAEHAATAEALVERIVSTAGYSASTFGLRSAGGGETLTATEVHARDKRSEITRQKKTRYWQPELEAILTVMLEVDRVVFGGPGSAGGVSVGWSDTSEENPVAVAETIERLARAEALSAATKVRMLHPEWDETEVEAEVQAIGVESGRTVPDPMGAGDLP